MHPDVAALLAVQEQDEAIRSLEGRLRGLEPRLEAIDRRRREAEQALERARASAAAEEQRQRELQARLAQHRQLHERSQAQLDHISRAREATAALSQFEQAGRLVGDSERELQAASTRAGQARDAVAGEAGTVEELARQDDAERSAIAEERSSLEAELREARGRRDELAQHVSRALLSRYDRISARRKSAAVFPLRGASCGSCDMAVPLQRRSVMSATGALETCEGCGALLYAAE